MLLYSVDTQQPRILKHPQSQSIAIGDPLHLTVESAPPNGHTQYVWYFNGLELPKEIEPEFYLNCFTEDDVGDYYCELSNGYGAVKSLIARVTLKEDDDIDS